MNTGNNNRSKSYNYQKPFKSQGRKTLFKRPCRQPHCPNYALTAGDTLSNGEPCTKSFSYCETHMSHEYDYDKHRPSSFNRGYNTNWQKARLHHLSQHPWCEHCLQKGLRTPATDVDHIIPHKGDMELFWDTHNWQSLCKSCHSRKTITEDMGEWGR